MPLLPLDLQRFVRRPRLLTRKGEDLRTSDLPANLSTAMGGAILRMGAGGIGRLAGLGAPAGLLFRDGWERGSASAWDSVGDAP